MKNWKVLLPVLATILLTSSCGNSGKKQANHQEVTDARVEEKQAPVANEDADEGFIREFYQFVFGEKEMTDEVLDKYLSAEMKQSLWTEDYDGCYEFWRFRTSAQDYNESVGDMSRIEDIRAVGNGWYVITYLDMGHEGRTEVKVSDGKIEDLKLDKSWE